MKRAPRFPLLAAGLALAAVSPAFAQSQPRVGAQSIIVNPAPTDLEVQVSVDKAGENPAYRIGEQIQVSVTVNQDAYVYLFSIHADGEIEVVLPNRYQGGASLVRAGERRTFPAAGASFRYTIGGPAGQDKVLAVAAKRQLNTDEIYRFEGDGPLAVARVRGQENLARALSIVVEPIPPADWVTDVTYYQVTGGTAAQPAPPQSTPARNPVTSFQNLPNEGAQGTVNPGPELVVQGSQVRSARLRLIDSSGRAVIDRREDVGKYCLTGGDDRCAGWDTRKLANGTYRLVADVTLSDGRTYAYEERVQINNPVNPATRFINLPSDVSGVLTPGPSLIVEGASVRSVRLRLIDSAGRSVINQLEQGEYFCLVGGGARCDAWDTRKHPNGSYRVVAEVTLDNGRTYEYEMTVRINNPSAQRSIPRLGGTLALTLPSGATIVRIADEDRGGDRDDDLEFEIQAQGRTTHTIADHFESSLAGAGWRRADRKGDDREVQLKLRKGNDDRVDFTIRALGNNRFRVQVKYRD